MEDFGYSKQEKENYFGAVVKKALMLGVGLFSIFFFLYITFSAYNYFLQNDEEARIIEPMVVKIKVTEDETSDKENSMQIDNSIYEDIFGTRKKQPKQEIKIRETYKAPALPELKKEEITSTPEPEVTKTPEKIIVYSQDKPQEEVKIINDEKRPKRKQIRVQIAAMTSKSAADKFSQDLKKQHLDLFSDLESFVQEVNLGKRGTFYRVQVGNFYDQIRAESFCKQYITKASKSKSDCIVVE